MSGETQIWAFTWTFEWGLCHCKPDLGACNDHDHTKALFLVLEELLLITLLGNGGNRMIYATSIFLTAANLKLQVFAKGSMFHSSLWVFAFFHRTRTGTLATIIAFFLLKKITLFLFFENVA